MLAKCYLVGAFIVLAPAFASAQGNAPAAALPPPEVQQLVDILRKPEVQAWLEKGAPTAAPNPAPTASADSNGRNLARDFRNWVAETRSHLVAIRTNALLIPGAALANWWGGGRRAPRGGPLVDSAADGRAARARIRNPETLLDDHPRLAQARAWPCRSTPWRQRLSVVGLRFGYNLLWLLSFAARQPGRPADVQLAALLKTDPQRHLPDHRRRPALGRPGAVPSVAATTPTLRVFPDRRRVGAALEAMERRSCWAGSSAAGWPCRCCGTSTSTSRSRLPIAYCARSRAVRARHGRAVAAPGAASRSREARGTGRSTSRSPSRCCSPRSGCCGCSA